MKNGIVGSNLRREPAINLVELAKVDPVAAQVGHAINSPRMGGIDLDGDEYSLSYAELFYGAQRLAPLPHLAAAAGRLQAWFASATFMPEPQAPVADGAPPKAVAKQLAIEIAPPGAIAAGPVTAAAGFTLTKTAPRGMATLTFGFPADTEFQKVDHGSLQLRLVDANGRDLEGAILNHRLSALSREMPGRPRFDVSFDLGQLPDTAYFRYTVRVQTKDLAADLAQPVLLSAYRELPAEVKPWLKPSAMMQSEAPEIVALAKKVRAGAETVQQLVKNTLQAMEKVRRPVADPAGAVAAGLDALTFLRSGLGSCTSNADLFAALMRANGVPCRVYNQIMGGMGQDMHFTNEYFVPGSGWVHVEPQGLELQTARTQGVFTGLVYPEMDTSLERPYFDGLFGAELDAAGRPRAQEKQIYVGAGLVTEKDAFPGTHYYGAGV